MSPFEAFEHTADVGLRVRAPDAAGLFAEAGRGFFGLLIDNLDDVRIRDAHAFELGAADLGSLMVDWLGELLFRFETEHIVLVEFDATLDETRLRVTARGEPLDLERHEPHFNIKAVTYHNLRVEPTPSGWLAEVILDI